MSAAVTPSPQPDAGTVPADADVLAMCEIWLALDFPEPSGLAAAELPDPQEVP